MCLPKKTQFRLFTGDYKHSNVINALLYGRRFGASEGHMHWSNKSVALTSAPNLSASLNITNSTIDIVLRIRAEMLNKSIDFICLFVILFHLGEAIWSEIWSDFDQVSIRITAVISPDEPFLNWFWSSKGPYTPGRISARVIRQRFSTCFLCSHPSDFRWRWAEWTCKFIPWH